MTDMITTSAKGARYGGSKNTRSISHKYRKSHDLEYNSGLIGTSKVLKIFVIGRAFRGESNLKIFKTLRVPINPNCTRDRAISYL